MTHRLRSSTSTSPLECILLLKTKILFPSISLPWGKKAPLIIMSIFMVFSLISEKKSNYYKKAHISLNMILNTCILYQCVNIFGSNTKCNSLMRIYWSRCLFLYLTSGYFVFMFSVKWLTFYIICRLMIITFSPFLLWLSLDFIFYHYIDVCQHISIYIDSGIVQVFLITSNNLWKFWKVLEYF